MKPGLAATLVLAALAMGALIHFLGAPGFRSAIGPAERTGGRESANHEETPVPVGDPGNSTAVPGPAGAEGAVSDSGSGTGPVDPATSEHASPRHRLEAAAQDGFGEVTGSVLEPQWITSRKIEIEACSSDGTTRTSADVSSSGSFTFHLDVEYTWRVHGIAGCGHRILESPEIVPIEGESVRPPSLQGIRLTTLVDQVQLKVLGPELEPVRARIDSLSEDADFLSFGTSGGERGTYEGLLCSRAHEVRVSQHGLRSADIVLSPGTQGVTLEEGYRVRLVLGDDVRPLGFGWRLGATPYDGDEAVPGRLLTFDGAQGIELSLPRAGEYRIEWSLGAPGNTNQRLLGPLDGATKTIEVRDSPGLQEIGLTIPNATLRAAAAELEREE